jgi:predicted metalloendopeptidase
VFREAKDADAADHFGNILSMLAWSTVKELSELRKVPERDVWLSHPAIVNAWYSPNHNTISKN